LVKELKDGFARCLQAVHCLLCLGWDNNFAYIPDSDKMIRAHVHESCPHLFRHQVQLETHSYPPNYAAQHRTMMDGKVDEDPYTESWPKEERLFAICYGKKKKTARLRNAFYMTKCWREILNDGYHFRHQPYFNQAFKNVNNEDKYADEFRHEYQITENDFNLFNVFTRNCGAFSKIVTYALLFAIMDKDFRKKLPDAFKPVIAKSTCDITVPGDFFEEENMKTLFCPQALLELMKKRREYAVWPDDLDDISDLCNAFLKYFNLQPLSEKAIDLMF
jgi:hypothetical protein